MRGSQQHPAPLFKAVPTVGGIMPEQPAAQEEQESTETWKYISKVLPSALELLLNREVK